VCVEIDLQYLHQPAVTFPASLPWCIPEKKKNIGSRSVLKISLVFWTGQAIICNSQPFFSLCSVPLFPPTPLLPSTFHFCTLPQVPNRTHLFSSSQLLWTILVLWFFSIKIAFIRPFLGFAPRLYHLLVITRFCCCPPFHSTERPMMCRCAVTKLLTHSPFLRFLWYSTPQIQLGGLENTVSSLSVLGGSRPPSGLLLLHTAIKVQFHRRFDKYFQSPRCYM